MKKELPIRQFRDAGFFARNRALALWRGWDWSVEEKMRRPSAKSSHDVIPGVLKYLRIDSRQADLEILKVWNTLIDPNIVAHAKPTGLRKGTLFVLVDSSAWLSEIVRYRKEEILEALQNSFGPDLICRISFRQG